MLKQPRRIKTIDQLIDEQSILIADDGGVNDVFIQPLLMAACKRLYNKVQELEGRIDTLENP